MWSSLKQVETIEYDETTDLARLYYKATSITQRPIILLITLGISINIKHVNNI